MIVSKTLDYAVRTLIYLGKRHGGGTVLMKEIAEKQKIPLSYLAKVMRQLVRAGIVFSEYGPNGGYSLKKLPSEITLRDVYEAVEGELRMVECFDVPGSVCVFTSCCGQADIWHEVEKKFIDILEGITIQDVIARDCVYSEKFLTINKREKRHANT
ncbi:transcriptional regulator, BadM/Rrf2 family [Candidatus Kryptobacter tengchongensis]|uniref:Transcriptional regulator, BadM/Rrf2 family n=2 Tax=Kryptobacter tengchongensis TaxID=1643429 RepID=A0A656DA94_KRYT1|nr:Rrf2 family transcriptional regulator [Candidatus Kryptobacter tengchongensis]CUS80642.1 transcriptional regulator, BadM/Rrf2 family [Candidatus Kryptobacter tengchongensis]CUS96325.1 transcriptional regulator, BadM/Rrf2 family [Candidatus Kryptobacter tengchongensis]CUT04364.1 transcriptional regulator, BadM/Rrf2 family [Candidatus Kryptobacter tengchongensis]CUU05827.1 transcriptional regulator, BadM/Rrf2 family [Candidatus Kryptobacter tengchongensis]CUU09383.1 transcriptional regulator,